MGNVSRTDNRRGSGETTPALWDPFRMMNVLLRWDPFGGEMRHMASGGEFAPRFDVRETKSGYMVLADLPGVKEEDLGVSLTGNKLTISGRREEEQSHEVGPYIAIERAQGTFARTVSLPEDADSERLTADLKDGVLTVRVPKRREAQEKKIPIGKRSSGPKTK